MKAKYYFFILITLILSSCGQASKPDKPVITVTIEPLRFFTEAIVGDHFKVVSMVPNGTSPETYDPTPQQLVNLANSDAYIKIGYIGFELSWMDKIQKNAKHLSIFDSSKGIDLIYAEGHHHGDHYHAGGVEPHTWNSTKNAKIMAKNILDAAIQLDSIHTTDYQENYKSLVMLIDNTEETIQLMLNNNPHAKGFMIYHPALSYYARDYGLEQISIEEEGKEPTPAHLKKLIEKCMNDNIHIIFIQPEFDQKNAEVIATQTNSQIVGINPLSFYWQDEMIHLTKALIEN